MISFGGVLTTILDGRPNLRLILLYPLLRTQPSHFALDLHLMKVRVLHFSSLAAL